MSKIILVALVGLYVFMVVCGFAAATSSVPERNQESEQRIASMEINQSSGNMTGEDYLIALMYAYINDTLTLYETHARGDSFESLKEEASSKFGEYRTIYDDSRFDTKLALLMSGSSECNGGGYDCSTKYPVMPRQGFIDLFLCELFHNDSELYLVYPHIGDSFDLYGEIAEARVNYKTRIAEEAERDAKQKKKVTEQLRTQQENEAHQIALDAHYKNVSENYSTELTNLINQSRFEDAINLSNEAIENLVTPYSNIMMINQGDIYVSMGMYEAAIESYMSARNNFVCSNESADYKENINQDFENNWNRIIQMKAGMALEYRAEQLHAMAFDDLRDAPNVKQLLSGHISNMPKYEFRVINYTAPDYSDIDDPGYWVQINISAYNDPEEIDDTEYLRKNIPICVDMFTALFSDEQISKVFIQLNESYLDKFGHTLESPSITMRLNNATAAKIGDWKSFKKYIGTDMSRFEQVIDIKRWY
jgi:tetratricopeptide (TPR) repeat protein